MQTCNNVASKPKPKPKPNEGKTVVQNVNQEETEEIRSFLPPELRRRQNCPEYGEFA